MRFSKTFQTGSSLPRYTFTVDPTSPIGIKWAGLGGQSTTGRAVGDPTPLDDGIGLIQLFMLGAIFWSPGFGAVYMSERVWSKWSSPSVEKRKTITGEFIQSYLGYPIEDTHRLDTPGGLREWTWMERGMVYVGPEGSWVVQGDIYSQYRILGGLGSALGVPTSDELGAPNGGRKAHFARGDIYLHGRTGAREVHGAILQRYLQLGGPASVLGYPTSDETSLRGSQGEIGRFNRFEFGSGIYFSGETGAWEVYGAIWAEWQGMGGATGKLGFPTSGETDTPSSGGRYNEFQHGVMICHDGGPFSGTYAVLDLQLVIERYTVNEDFNVQVHITATPAEVNHGRMPADGEFDAGVKAFEPPLIMVDVATVRADTVLTVWLLAISENTVGEDDRMGIVTANFNINNVWGLLDTDFNHSGGAFTAVLRVQPRTQVTVTDPHALFWPFENTSTPSLTWETFAETFRDVKATDKHLNFNPFDLNLHPWEIFLYAVFYNSLAAGGSCFGMCLAAIYAREHASVYLEPLRDNPFNPYERNHRPKQPVTKLNADLAGDGGVLDEINVKHGYQMGAGMVEFFLSRWMAGALHDPERAYRESYADFQAGNWPLLTISDQDAFSQDHGHAVLPYEWVPTPDGIAHHPPRVPLIIYVKNPNFPQAARDDIRCRIEIDKLTWKWTFQFDTKETWRGSGVTGGRLLAIPFTELNARPVTPGYTVLELIAAGVLLVLGGAAETQQITDGYGRTLFRYIQPADHRLETFHPAPVKSINWDRATAIPNLMQVPSFGSTRIDELVSSTTNGHGDVLHLRDSSSELYYHRPGPPPKGGARLMQAQASFAGRGVIGLTGSNRQATTAAAAQTLSSAPQDALHFELKGTGHGQMRWSIVAPRMSVTVLASMEPGVVDSIHLGGTGGHFQSLTLQFPQATRFRTVSLTVTGWRGENRQHSRSFVVEGLAVDASDSVRAQLTDGGSELILDNPGSAKTFTLRLVAGVEALTVAERLNVPLDAASKIRLRPSSWSTTANLHPAAIHLDTLDASGRNVLGSLQI